MICPGCISPHFLSFSCFIPLFLMFLRVPSTLPLLGFYLRLFFLFLCIFYNVYDKMPYLKSWRNLRRGMLIVILFTSFEIFAFRHNFSSRSKTQPEYRGGKCWWSDRQLECKWKPHGSDRSHSRQSE